MLMSRQAREPVPPMVSMWTDGWGTVSEGLAASAPASATYESSNAGVWFPLRVPSYVVAKRMWWANGSTVSATYNVEAGIYANTGGGKPGAKLATTELVLQGTASQVQFSGFNRCTREQSSYGYLEFNTSDADNTSYSVASATYTAGRLYVIIVYNTHGTSADAVNSITGTGITFTSRSTTQYDSNLRRTSVWTAVPTSNTTTGLTIDFNGVTQTSCDWTVMEFVNVDTTTNDGIVQTATNTGSSTSPSVTLSAFGSTANITLASVGRTASTTTFTAAAGFERPVNNSHSFPNGGHSVIWKDSPGTTPGGTLSVSEAWGVVGVEIKAAAQPFITLRPGLWWLYFSCSTSSATFMRSDTSGSELYEFTKFQQWSVGPGSAPATATPVVATGMGIYLFGIDTRGVG